MASTERDKRAADLLMGMVDAKLSAIKVVKDAHRDFRTRIPIRHASDIAQAAEMRGISIRSYLRRALLSFVAYDLGKDVVEMLSDEPAQRLKSEGPKTNRRVGGEGHGNWRIERLS